MSAPLVPVRKVAFGGGSGAVTLLALYVTQLTGVDMPVGLAELVVFAVTSGVAYFTKQQPPARRDPSFE